MNLKIKISVMTIMALSLLTGCIVGEKEVKEPREQTLFDLLPKKDAIKIVNGNGKNKVAVFGDPACGYSRHYEGTLSGLKDTTIYVFPVGVISDFSDKASIDLFCSEDNAKAWKGWMISNVSPSLVRRENCDSSTISRNNKLFRSVNAGGTPHTILYDGTHLNGVVQLKELQEEIEFAMEE